MEDGILNFICAITGHDKETIHQMWNDYFSSPKSSQLEPMVILPEADYACENCKHCNDENNYCEFHNGNDLFVMFPGYTNLKSIGCKQFEQRKP